VLADRPADALDEHQVLDLVMQGTTTPTSEDDAA
jgi:ribose transport system ATP-binding protein